MVLENGLEDFQMRSLPHRYKNQCSQITVHESSYNQDLSFQGFLAEYFKKKSIGRLTVIQNLEIVARLLNSLTIEPFLLVVMGTGMHLCFFFRIPYVSQDFSPGFVEISHSFREMIESVREKNYRWPRKIDFSALSERCE